MAKSAVAAVVDEVISATLAPSLKAMGFRKKARHWHRQDDGVYRGVTLQMRSMSTADEAAFTIELGSSYETLGHPPIDKPMGSYVAHGRVRAPMLRSGWDDWYEFSVVDDPDPIAELTAAVGADWSDVGEPFVVAAADPRALCELALDGVLPFASRGRSLAEALGDRQLVLALFRRELDLVCAGDIGTPPDNPWRDHHLLRQWRRTLRVAESLGVSLAPADIAAATEVVRRVTADGQLMTADDRRDLDEVATALGLR